ncbi:MAG: serine/threonine-protein kinase [Gemmatimonas sp.]|jgi:serine/threonine protein kinase
MPRSYTAELGTALAGRYLIEEHLGKGGMATVYRARDLKHDRAVALKVLNPELGAVLGAERFLTEIKVTATMQHPNLLTLIDSGEVNGLLYYVMPLLDGETLRAYIARSGQLPVNDAVRITTGIAQALAYAHARDIIHRDLKPENVILQHGQPIVLDFGIALALRNAGGARMTQTGVAMGTPQYMSPEQASGEKHVDARVDIYALGTLLFEMLAGEAPHTGPTPQSVMSRVITTEARSVASVRPLVPAHIAAAVAKALARNPADRFSTVDEFVAALRPWSVHQGPTALTSDSAAATSPSPRGYSTPIVLGVTLVALAVGFVAGRMSAP